MTFDLISSFAVYYGFGREKELSQYGLAIIDPAGHDKSAVDNLKKSSTLAVAYLSFLELSPENKALPMMSEKDFLYQNGQPLKNIEYNNLLADFCSDKWQKILFERISELYLGFGYDGIFIDTLADIEYFDMSELMRSEQLSAVIAFLRRVRARFPELILLQNNGTEFIYNYTAELIDGICIENPPSFDKSQVEKLCYLKDGLKLKVLLLTDGTYPLLSRQAVKCAAEKHGFLYYHSPEGYLSL